MLDKVDNLFAIIGLMQLAIVYSLVFSIIHSIMLPKSSIIIVMQLKIIWKTAFWMVTAAIVVWIVCQTMLKKISQTVSVVEMSILKMDRRKPITTFEVDAESKILHIVYGNKVAEFIDLSGYAILSGGEDIDFANKIIRIPVPSLEVNNPPLIEAGA